MTGTTRWQLGDVIIWIQTGALQDAKTDSDIYLRFYDESDSLIGWVRVFERGDLAGFEEGELNCGFLGNLNKQTWLGQLRQSGTRMGVRIESVSDDRPEWYLDHISLDFRVGPVADDASVRTWQIGEWIVPFAEEKVFVAEATSPIPPSGFMDIGFEKELEIEAGNLPEDSK